MAPTAQCLLEKTMLNHRIHHLVHHLSMNIYLNKSWWRRREGSDNPQDLITKGNRKGVLPLKLGSTEEGGAVPPGVLLQLYLSES